MQEEEFQISLEKLLTDHSFIKHKENLFYRDVDDRYMAVISTNSIHDGQTYGLNYGIEFKPKNYVHWEKVYPFYLLLSMDYCYYRKRMRFSNGDNPYQCELDALDWHKFSQDVTKNIAQLTSLLLLDKEEIKTICQGERKEFYAFVGDILKSFGFVKKKNAWYWDIDEEMLAIFQLQKSMYSDQYYFNSDIALKRIKEYIPNPKEWDCSLSKRVVFTHACNDFIVDWQLTDRELIKQDVQEHLLHYFQPLKMGGISYLAEHRHDWTIIFDGSANEYLDIVTRPQDDI